MSAAPSPKDLAALAADLDLIKQLSIALAVLSCISVLLRLYVKHCILRKLTSDDWVLSACLFVFIACVVLTRVFLRLQSTSDSGTSVSVSVTSRLSAWSSGTYFLSVQLVKIAAGIFMVRIFGRHDLVKRYLIIGLTVLSSLLGIVAFLIDVASCAQSSYLTDPTKALIACRFAGPFIALSIIWSTFNAFVDVVFAVLSIYILAISGLKSSDKLSGAVLLACGFAGVGASIARVYLLFKIDSAMRTLLMVRCSIIEIGFCICVAALITLRPLLQKLSAAPAFSNFSWNSQSGQQTDRERPGIGLGRRVDPMSQLGDATCMLGVDKGNREDSAMIGKVIVVVGTEPTCEEPTYEMAPMPVSPTDGVHGPSQ